MTAVRPSDDTVRVAHPLESLGEWCVRQGLASVAQIDACLRAQRDARRDGRPVPRLGELLVMNGILTPDQVARGLAAQRKEIRSCPRCEIRMNVPIRDDAAAYRCPRCQGPLLPAVSPRSLDAVDDDPVIVSRDPVPADVEEALARPGTRFGKYVLLRELGRGGIGVIHLAWDTYLSQHVALKRLRPDPQVHAGSRGGPRFQDLIQEARHAIRLRHPGIVSIFDVGRVGSDYYISMEYLEGETFADELLAARRRGKPSSFYEHPRQTVVRLAEIARAVHYAHTRPAPIVHCDLKPNNVVIDRDGHAHVLDFGLARNLKADLPSKGEISGTPSYMAPEQASGDPRDIDPRTDVYAMGAILYEVLTGRPPFVGEPLAILQRLGHDVPRRPSETLQETTRRSKKDGSSTQELLLVPPLMEALCMRCLSKDRALRPPSMEEVAESLDRVLRPHLAPAPKPETTLVPSSAPEVKPSEAPPPSRRGLQLAVAAASSAGLLLAAILFRLGLEDFSGDLGQAVRAAAEIDARLAEFRPDRAAPLAEHLERRDPRGGRLVRETERLATLQERAARALSSARPELPELALRRGRLAPARVAAAEARGLRVLEGGAERSIPWEDLEPWQVARLVRAALPEPSDEDRLALGIYCLKAGRTDEAREEFLALRGRELGSLAERYLSEMNR
jgi:serine/threonine protein kinase